MVRRKKGEMLAQEPGKPAPQVVYIERKRGGFLSGCAKFIGVGIILLVILGVIGVALGTNSDSADGDSDEDTTENTASDRNPSTPALGSGELPGQVGDTLESDGMQITLTNPQFVREYNYSTPKGGYIFLIVDIRMENVDDENHGYSGMRFSARDMESGAEFDDTFALLDTPISTDDLSPGEFVTGQIALEVQETATNLRVKYKVSAIGGGDVYWLVPKE